MSIIESYLTDLITIITLTRDKWGTRTESSTTGIKARVELENKFVKNDRGEEIMGKGLIIFQSNQTITYENRIKIEKINGIAYNRQDKEFSILQISPPSHGFESTHYEVIIG